MWRTVRLSLQALLWKQLGAQVEHTVTAADRKLLPRVCRLTRLLAQVIRVNVL
jgi:hypothetical protein